jgi:exosortase/archaeosortase family protein
VINTSYIESIVVKPVAEMQATNVSLLLLVADFNSEVHSSVVIANDLGIDINPECTGFYLSIILISALFALPGKRSIKLIIFTIISFFIYTFNILRLVLLVLIGIYWFNYFDIVHEYIIQPLSYFLSITIWFILVSKFLYKKGTFILSTHKI